MQQRTTTSLKAAVQLLLHKYIYCVTIYQQLVVLFQPRASNNRTHKFFRLDLTLELFRARFLLHIIFRVQAYVFGFGSVVVGPFTTQMMTVSVSQVEVRF